MLCGYCMCGFTAVLNMESSHQGALFERTTGCNEREQQGKQEPAVGEFKPSGMVHEAQCTTPPAGNKKKRPEAAFLNAMCEN